MQGEREKLATLAGSVEAWKEEESMGSDVNSEIEEEEECAMEGL